MGPHRPKRRPLVVSALVTVAAATTALLLLPGPGSDPARAEKVLRAGSVCEAHALKQLKAENPALEIEIPPEYDKQFLTWEACASHDAAWDADAPGPSQPIPFSHLHHAGRWEIDCLYCHTGTERSQAAGMPSVELCMGCHAQFDPAYDQLEGIRILKRFWEEGAPIPWVQIHRVPEHVQFQHQAHVRAGVECQTCHGEVEAFDKLFLVPDTAIGPAGIPARKLEMGWCINCHRDLGASQDCFICHY